MVALLLALAPKSGHAIRGGQDRAWKGSPVKIRELTHRFEGFPPIRAWPPVWVPGGWVPDGRFGEDGVLESVRRVDDRLSLRMRYEGHEHAGGLQWDPPPSLTTVEHRLQANLGKIIRDLGELDVGD